MESPGEKVEIRFLCFFFHNSNIQISVSLALALSWLAGRRNPADGIPGFFL